MVHIDVLYYIYMYYSTYIYEKSISWLRGDTRGGTWLGGG
jgi:hypothetical protein